jgi:hypothetical protein
VYRCTVLTLHVSSYLEFPKREFPRSGIAGIPIGIPGSKTALFGEFPGIPWDSHTGGVLLHTEGVPLRTEGVFWFRFVPENP